MAHVTRSGKQSKAWQALEYKVAELLRAAGFRGAKRVIKESHESFPDVDVPGIPELAIDTKYTNGGFAQHTQFMEEVETYVNAYQFKRKGKYSWAAMPFRPGGSKDILVVLRLEVWIEMLKRLYLREETGGWLCPRCPNTIEKVGEWDGHHHYKCPSCQMAFQTSHVETPEERERVVSQRDKSKPRPLVLDNSSKTPSDEFTPQPGQRKLQDLVRLKQQATAKPKARRKSKKEPA